ncbi:DUF4168 domain-containing protein [Salipiger sp. P9]|uniref:DUF4168 domain-containing protein n=1 Tax=Salipiger pentaromativorans TaxID=2943193 RepID=UPI0021583EDA|nr:DUF4168 domain-containing protein [Salipiger pentaromativorans]MCR8546801.1 DUF4168 domain-containing protein [Salipiger pentaromativorans]
MTLHANLLKSTVIAALIAAPLAPAFAQSMAPEAPAEAAPATPETGFTEAQLTSFVDAAMQVQALQEDYEARIDAAQAPEGKQALAEQAQAEMVAAVDETEGMDVETYNEISAAAQADPELNERLLAMVQTRQGGGATMME